MTERVCDQCGEVFVARGEYHARKQRLCSPACVQQERAAQAQASYPPKEEIEWWYVHNGLSDKGLGGRYGRSHQWAFKVRRHYGIPGREPSPPRKPLAQRSDRARWNLGLKPERACRNCGRSDGALHLHHVVPRSTCRAAKYDLRNGVPLCTRCHLGWHHRRVELHRDIFTEEEWAYVSSLDLVGQRVEAWLDDRYPLRENERGAAY